MKYVTVDDFYKKEKEGLELEVLAGKTGMMNKIASYDINRPGLALAGYLDYFACSSIQIMGNTEINYMKQFSVDKLEEKLNKMVSFPIPCFVISRNLEPMPIFLEIAEKKNIPVIRSKVSTMEVISRIIIFLDEQFSPEVTMHGVVVDVFGVGVLILGSPGIGKSETALELVERGHRLIADDVVMVKRMRQNLYAQASPVIGHNMEIRGLGIVDVKSVFGVGSIRNMKRISVIINLEEWDSQREYDRLGLEESTMKILDVDVPEITIPVRPGRNLAIIVEVGALNERLKELGMHPAKTLSKKIIDIMKEPKNR